jgi:hypothetical protein
MAAIDSVYTSVANPGSSFTATAATTGDSLSVRNFPSPGQAYLAQVIRRGATAGPSRVRSPRLHDSQTGINTWSAEVVDVLPYPLQFVQTLVANDTLIAEIEGGTAETDAIGLVNYYTDLPGSVARLANWGDISGIIKNAKAFYTVAAAGNNVWTDTPITTTDNQLHANEDYAILGYRTDAACALVGVKGQETGNLRNCGPGTTSSLDTTNWYVRMSEASGMPCIPVFNANNRFSFYVSAVDVAAIATLHVTLFCVELSQPAPV